MTAYADTRKQSTLEALDRYYQSKQEPKAVAKDKAKRDALQRKGRKWRGSK